MGLATHLGPWILGTVKSTTGTTAGTVRNTGVCSVAQSATVNYNDAATTTAFWIPAGSLITSVAFYSATGITGTSPTLTVFVGSTNVASVSLTTATAFAGAVTFTAAAAGTIANIGSIDQPIKYTVGGTGLSAGSGTLLVEYLVRNSDGTYVPTSFTGP